MGSTRTTRRTAARYRRRPDVEALEVRTLLSTSRGSGPLHPAPHHLAAHSARPADGGDATAPTAAGTYFDQTVGAPAARSQYGVDGTGMTVAVIDTGVNYDHEDLGGGFGPGHKVVAGYDFTNNTADPFSPTIEHGTGVAGLLAGDDPTDPGIAPGADIVSLKVFDNNDQGSFTNVANALQWVVNNHAEYNISVVNLSLSDGQNYTTNWYANDGGVGQQITSLVAQLDALNIPVVTATGNSFNGSQGEGFAAIVPDTISVTATDSNDHIVADAQRLGSAVGGASATTIAAPGQDVLAPQSGNSFATVSGTSFATPIVSGAVVLMQQVYESRFGSLPTVPQLDSWLQGGADPVSDPVTGITIGRLDIPKSLALIPSPQPQYVTPPPVTPPTATPPATPTPTPTTTPSTPTSTTAAPAPTPTTTPTVTTTTTPSTSTGAGTPATPSAAYTLWVDGQEVTSADLSNATGKLAGLPSWFVTALQSFKSWATGGGESTSTVQVWGATNPGSSQPAGSVSLQSRVKVTHVHNPAKNETISRPRPAHPFVASRNRR